MEEFGNEENGKIQVNIRKHKGNIGELADTVKHELYHAKHPKASEKKTYAITRKAMKEMSYVEKQKLAAKVRNKKTHYAQGALKRKFKMGNHKVEPGEFIKKFNETRRQKRSSSKSISLRRISIDGLV